MNDYDTVSDVELTTDHYQFLREAGASDQIIALIQFTDEQTGIRNSAREEVRKYAYWGDLDGSPDDFNHIGGHFFSAMWDGDLFEAWLRADMNNRRLMMELFGESRIIGDGIVNGHPSDYVETMVTEPAL